MSDTPEPKKIVVSPPQGDQVQPQTTPPYFGNGQPGYGPQGQPFANVNYGPFPEPSGNYTMTNPPGFPGNGAPGNLTNTPGRAAGNQLPPGFSSQGGMPYNVTPGAYNPPSQNPAGYAAANQPSPGFSSPGGMPYNAAPGAYNPPSQDPAGYVAGNQRPPGFSPPGGMPYNVPTQGNPQAQFPGNNGNSFFPPQNQVGNLSGGPAQSGVRTPSYTHPLGSGQLPFPETPPDMRGSSSSFQGGNPISLGGPSTLSPFGPPNGNYAYNGVPTMHPPLSSSGGVFPFTPNSVQPQSFIPPPVQPQTPASETQAPPRLKKRRFYRRTPAYRGFARLREASHYSLKARMLMVFLVLCLLAPLVVGTAEGINTYTIYKHASAGIQHLLNLRTIFFSGTNHASGFLDTNKLAQARQELNSAHDDFVQLNESLNQDMTVSALSAFLPKQIATARSLSQIGVDVTDMGQNLVSTALVLAPSLRSPLASDPNAKGPLITQPMLNQLDQSIVYVLPRLNDVEKQSQNLSLDSLPITSKQKDQFKLLVQLLPTARTDLSMAHDLMGALGWILGVGQPRRLLVQTMDRAELRPTGGFTGQYGELDINGARLAPFSLKDIGALEDFNPNSPVLGNQAPAAYRSWWPFADWGLRDSNLSVDFPTSAKMAMSLYKLELNQQVDGVVYFSPFLISRVLQVIGPVQITKYQDTVNAQNLEERLHYYQLDNAGIRKIKILNHTPDAPDSDVRKLFTSEVARVLMDRVRHAPPDEILTLASEMLHDLQTKDLQIYVNNPQIQGLLEQYNSSSELDTFTKHDGFMVVQANVNATKASQYTNTILHDTVTLDANGGATHVLQIRLVYNQNGPVYGMDTLRDYIRIYTPQNSQMLSGDGFEASGYYCGEGYGFCPSPDIYQNGDLLCPTGIDNAGVTPILLGDPYSVKNHPFRNVGSPPNTTSDMPGHAMFGGYMVVPKNCTATATLSWYVPPIGQGSYSLLVQRQPSTLPELDITLLTTPGSCSAYEKPGLHFDGIVGGPDMTFSLKMKPPASRGDSSCYTQPPV